MYKKGFGLNGWLVISILWLFSITFDHIWLDLDKGLPSWDQAEYLTNAIKWYMSKFTHIIFLKKMYH